MKLGVFSGTFDPVHRGHIWLAQTALEQFGLERIVFLPEPKPRRKTPKTPYEHRRAMLEIATKSDDRLDVLDIPADSHSVKGTLGFIVQQYGDTDVLKIIMGADVFENINNWDNFDLLKDKAGILVCLRTEDDGESALEMATKLGMSIEMVSSDYSLASSSNIRHELAKGKTPESLSKDICEYINTYKLYEAK